MLKSDGSCCRLYEFRHTFLHIFTPYVDNGTAVITAYHITYFILCQYNSAINNIFSFWKFMRGEKKRI